MEPSFKQHTAVDDRCGIIVDVKTTTGEINEGKELLEQIGRVEETTGIKVKAATADMAYAHTENYSQLERREIEAVIPIQQLPTKSKSIPIYRFKYDAQNQVVRCPRGKILRRATQTEKGWVYRAAAKDCRNCPLQSACISSTAKARTVLITEGYESLLRARRRWRDRDENMKDKYRRHKWRVEGAHGEAKTQHGLRRAVRRGIANVSVQVYLTAMVMNLKRLAAFILSFFVRLESNRHHRIDLNMLRLIFSCVIEQRKENYLNWRLAAREKVYITFSTVPQSPIFTRSYL
jgi:hypothetical protein